MNLPALHPETLRLVAFLGLLGLFALLEHRWPRRPLTVAKGRRWLVNLLIVAADTLAVRLVVPVVPFAMAALAAERGWGLFNLVDAGTTVPLVVQHGLAAGRKVTLNIPALQMQRPDSPTEDQKRAMDPLKGVALPVAGNDEFTLVLT